MMNEIIQTRPDVHRGWLEAELDAQIFLADTDNANAVAKMADDQTEGVEAVSQEPCPNGCRAIESTMNRRSDVGP